ncbi:iron complex transport system permease protein [Fulvimarina manganoxydans]|uniref:Iron complex transport system permease protein n=1 Tax=Fulvimarina manganoxydans TaxID=937218 RepID=A0A1W2AR09_9HYPH|nr:iron ABC transporter permease [Fulvimarina manganoxydans]SMC63103.1 iron complex transport system permease protein [Fulvimarina manganoxydans]
MRHRGAFLISAAVLLVVTLFLNLSLGAIVIPTSTILSAFLSFDRQDYAQNVVLYQRLPRALIALYVGALFASSGSVLQGLTRNPLASPATLGISAGAAAFVVGGVMLFDFGLEAQGFAALAGAILGFLASLTMARFAGLSRDPRGLSLILSGALVSMLLIGLANALLLSDPSRRADLLSWISGNINHVYADRLFSVWWLGAVSLGLLFALARPLTLMSLGREQAASAGVNVDLVTRLSLAAVMVGSGSAVAICGPIGFVGLVVPHLVRPFVGQDQRLGLPACALTGAIACLLADMVAREAFQPFVLNTGVLLDLLGGLAFLLIVKRFYLAGGEAAR